MSTTNQTLGLVDSYGRPLERSNGDAAGSMRLRRWDSAKTDRLNEGHWTNVLGNEINVDLAGYLETLRARAAHEAAQNPYIEGIVATHANDLVGPHGPSLQVQSDSKVYNGALESVWQDWWAEPTFNTDLSGPDLLRLWDRGLWFNGEYLAQMVTRPDALPIQFGIQPILAKRLATPPAQAGDADVALGVRRNRVGRVTQYYISDPKPMGVYRIDLSNYNPIPADLIIHGFSPIEEDQVRGVPWLASVLQIAADLRDYDAQVLDAARAAADYAVLLTNRDQDAVPFTAGDSADIQRRSITVAPAGYGVEQLQPHQPSTQYVEYRRERLAELGRPVSMPLMLIRLTAENHNYSSARMDAQIYQRGLQVLQAWLGRHTLNRLAREVAREAALAGLTPQPPASVRYAWTWMPMPHVDPAKESKAEGERLEHGTQTWFGAIASHGLDPEVVVEQLRKETAIREEINLPVFGQKTGRPADEPDEPDDQDDNDEPKTGKDSRNGKQANTARA